MSRRKRRAMWYRHLEPQVGRVVRVFARALAPDDPDLRDDLMQDATIAVWAIEPDRLDRAQRPAPLARRTALHAMITSYRQHLTRQGITSTTDEVTS